MEPTREPQTPEIKASWGCLPQPNTQFGLNQAAFPTERLEGTVTAITGHEKGSGKTTFLNWALPKVRRAGPVAVFSIGVDGALKAHASGLPAPEIRVEPGDLVLTTEHFARASGARFEVLETLQGIGALGRLFLGRSIRGGSVTLVGSEHLSALAETIARVRAEGWAGSVLVDGAVNRLTQVSALGDLHFVFTLRLDPSNLAKAITRLRALAALDGLPEEPEPPATWLRWEGPFTAESLASLDPEIQGISLEDFTKLFLEPSALLRFLERYPCSLRRRFGLLGCSVALRNLSREAFHRALGPLDFPVFNPYEAFS